MVSAVQDQAVNARTKLPERLRFIGKFDWLGGVQQRDFDPGVFQFGTPQWRKARVAESGGEGVLGDIGGQWTTGFEAADATA